MKTKAKAPKVKVVVSNLDPNGMCCSCGRILPVVELLTKHRLKDGTCPDERGLFTLPPRGKKR